ncbi:MAG TPA: DUF2298 domain-containing protein [Phototrophicaceae bacterium]|nr:DUF2298 domain-containing protein [Phototrophicaceae bacterium]
MLLDWLSREGVIVLSWWALVTAAGIAALPLCLRLLGGLPDRGYTLARAAGLLLVGFVFWLLASLGFLTNTTDSMAFAWVVVLIVGLALYLGGGERIDLRAWWKENNRVVIIGEILFIVLLFAWAIFRAYQNNLSGTEKPMELAFLSSAMRSPSFPPADPWLSGYAISYYYFGYVIMAMLSMLSGVSSTIGFNMITALLFALTGLTVFGVVYNLVRSRALTGKAEIGPQRGTAIFFGLLGMVLVILLGNFETLLLEVPYETGAASASYLQFWDVNTRTTPITTPVGNVDQWEYWWWFKDARVLNDFDISGQREEVIDEFPQFSFLLSDNHPHVLALPFAALALGLALNTLLRRRKPNRNEIIFYGICFGGLIFLNTWDGPVYLIVLVAAEALRRLMERGRLIGRDWRALALLGVTLLVVAVVCYLPFLAAFRSQLSGLLPNLQSPTLFQQYFMMYGPLLLLFVPFMLVEIWRARARMNWRLGVEVGLGLIVLLFALMFVLTIVAWLIPDVRGAVLGFVDANGGWPTVIADLLAKRITHIITTIVLALLIIVIVARLFPRRDYEEPEDELPVDYPPQTGFALLLIGAGLVLTLVPEFVYLRDTFGTRMNTVFKFYYQGWLMFSIASAYGFYAFFSGKRVPNIGVRAAYVVLALFVLIAGLSFPVVGIYSRAIAETGRDNAATIITPTLDGGGTISGGDDYQAALCLSGLVGRSNVVIASAVGNSYDWPAGAISTYTGIPTVFNWPYHEVQWRGATYSDAVGTRQQDIDRLYTDPTWANTVAVINKYNINYIVFGSKEASVYPQSSETKFLDHLDVTCQSGGTRIFHVTPAALAQAK